MLDDQSQIDYLVTYGYDDDNGLLDTVTYGESPNQRIFTYDYVPESDLAAGWDVALDGQDTLHTSRTYEDNRDLVDAVQNKVNSTTLSLYDYTNDPGGRRIARADSGTAFGSPSPPESNTFAYNARSELIEADMDAGLFEYAFDKIGNRITRHLDSSLLTSYDANHLNQYTNITPAGSQLQIPAHDDDGNLTDDGDAWAYAWNGVGSDARGSLAVNASNGYHATGWGNRDELSWEATPSRDSRPWGGRSSRWG